MASTNIRDYRGTALTQLAPVRLVDRGRSHPLETDTGDYNDYRMLSQEYSTALFSHRPLTYHHDMTLFRWVYNRAEMGHRGEHREQSGRSYFEEHLVGMALHALSLGIYDTETHYLIPTHDLGETPRRSIEFCVLSQDLPYRVFSGVLAMTPPTRAETRQEISTAYDLEADERDPVFSWYRATSKLRKVVNEASQPRRSVRPQPWLRRMLFNEHHDDDPSNVRVAVVYGLNWHNNLRTLPRNEKGVRKAYEALELMIPAFRLLSPRVHAFYAGIGQDFNWEGVLDECEKSALSFLADYAGNDTDQAIYHEGRRYLDHISQRANDPENGVFILGDHIRGIIEKKLPFVLAEKSGVHLKHRYITTYHHTMGLLVPRMLGGL
ncbi:hypothetical protein J4460_04630 [Candidatus Woesearchaeota archaeon]|nr:hypothetical protein [uncultured archaeon]MBS3129933.1 hypothetical protein [Candidatus Woesearchaeota archaeon]HIH38062.1 hypothetical protein [Candidatus Woesearchaeota archaeon]HIH48158.1 hypothetical protein [Candidatus Woesearchaeota archaeon]HIJ04303.1 hypothetical protein [Candidatus Woesearchaeota archaeon]